MYRHLLLCIFLLPNIVENCPDKDMRCQKCTENNFCDFCVYSFPNKEGVCTVPTTRIDGCYSYSQDGVCAECMLGFYKSYESICYPLTEKNKANCALSFISVSSCSHCKNSMLTLNGKCPARRKCSDPNCDVCFMSGSQEACFVCVANYVLFGDSYQSAKCIPPPRPEMDGCYYTEKTDLCRDCNFGYYFSNGFCLPSEINRYPESVLIARVWMMSLVFILSNSW